MTSLKVAKALMAFPVTGTTIIVALADVFNATHLFNPA